jgi:hypothetical protein
MVWSYDVLCAQSTYILKMVVVGSFDMQIPNFSLMGILMMRKCPIKIQESKKLCNRKDGKELLFVVSSVD